MLHRMLESCTAGVLITLQTGNLVTWCLVMGLHRMLETCTAGALIALQTAKAPFWCPV